MAYSYSSRSEHNLSTCDSKLQRIFYKLLIDYDHTVVCGHRNAIDQNLAYDSGNSKVQWPNSKHNDYPSNAVDVIPYPSQWGDINQFYFMAGRVFQIADELGYKIRWGGDWDRDNDFNDQTFMDLAHFELIV